MESDEGTRGEIIWAESYRYSTSHQWEVDHLNGDMPNQILQPSREDWERETSRLQDMESPYDHSTEE